jgi:hypothetical protein
MRLFYYRLVDTFFDDYSHSHITPSMRQIRTIYIVLCYWGSLLIPLKLFEANSTNTALF